MSDIETRSIILSRQRTTKALIRLRRLISAFVVRIWHKQVFSWRGSYGINYKRWSGSATPPLLNFGFCPLRDETCLLKYFAWEAWDSKALQYEKWIHPLLPSIPFSGPRQTVYNKSRRRRTWRLIRVYNVCSQEFYYTEKVHQTPLNENNMDSSNI